MANILEYTLSLNDKITGKLTKIGIENGKQLDVWAKVQRRVADADSTMKKCGVSVGSLRERVAALRAEREWIPADKINAIRRSNIEIGSLERQIRKLETVNGGRLKAWFANLKASVPIVGMITNPLVLLGAAVFKVGNYIKGSQDAWLEQAESETKLAAVMKNTMNASKGEVDSILKLTAAQQRLGVIDDTVQTAGSQELATYLTKTDSLKKLLPVMNDMLAQQYGLNATQEQAVTIGSMMGKVMDGQVGALSRYGYKFTAAQERILKYGNESQRAATLAEVVTSAVGGVNEALANTPEGKLKQHANTMGDLQERVGQLYTQVKASLLPIFEWLGQSLESTIDWLEGNKETILIVVHAVANAFKAAFTIVGKIIGGVTSAFGWWIDKLREGNTPVTIITTLLGALTLAMIGMTVQAKIMALWAGIVTTAKWLWAAAQNGLNLALLTNPLTWIIAGIIALIAVIAYVCYKIEGWGSLWDGIVGFMKHTFLAYVESIKLYWTTLVNGIMIGLDMIKLGWYKFKEAVGMGDSQENQAAIARINADVEARQKAIVDGANKVIEHAQKAKESLQGISMSWNSEKSISGLVGGLKAKFGIGAPAIPGMNPEEEQGEGEGGGGSGGAAASSIATGGSRSSTINITLKDLVGQIIYQGGYEGSRDEMEKDLTNRLIQVLQMARTAQ